MPKIYLRRHIYRGNKRIVHLIDPQKNQYTVMRSLCGILRVWSLPTPHTLTNQEVCGNCERARLLHESDV